MYNSRVNLQIDRFQQQQQKKKTGHKKGQHAMEKKRERIFSIIH